MRKNIFKIVIPILFIGILAFQFNNSFQQRVKPPSEDWSKEVSIARVDGDIKSYPKIIKYKDYYAIAYQNGADVNVEITDQLGNKIKDIPFTVGDEFIKYINLLKDDESIYVNWTTSQAGVKNVTQFKIDDKFNVKEEPEIKDISSVLQIDESTLVIVYKDRIEVRDIKTNKSIYEGADNAQLVAGTKTPEGYLITYQENDRYFKYFFIKNGTTSKVKLAGVMAPDSKGYFDGAVVGSDGKAGYILVEVKSALDQFGTIRCLRFSYSGDLQEVTDLKLGFTRFLYNPVVESSGDEMRVIAGCERSYGKKASQYDMVDFTMKDGKVLKYSFASRTQTASMYPAVCDDTLVFCDNTGTDAYTVYMASRNKNFREINNAPRKSEATAALSDTFLGFIYSIVFIFVFGVKWIIIGIFLISLLSFFGHSLSPGIRKILYSVSYAAAAGVKAYTIYSFTVMNSPGILPGGLNNAEAVIAICVFISLLGFALGYNKYRKDVEVLPIWSFLTGIMVDTILTQMIFIPFIY